MSDFYDEHAEYHHSDKEYWKHDQLEDHYNRIIDFPLMLDMLIDFIPKHLNKLERIILYKSFYQDKELKQIANELSSISWVMALRKGKPLNKHAVLYIRKKAFKKLLEHFNKAKIINI